MSSFAEVNQAIETRVNSMRGKPDIAWPNVEYNPDINKSFFLLNLVKGIRVKTALANTSKFIAIDLLSIFIHIPKNEGAKKALDFADRLFDHFPVGLELRTKTAKHVIKVKKHQIEVGSVVDAFYRLPAVIELESITG